MKEKSSEEFEVIEEVFDKLTLEGIYKLMKKGVIDRIYGVVKAGKEGRIYWGLTPQEEEIAIKIYYTTTAEFRKGMLKYIEGDPRFKRIRRDPRRLIYAWTRKEFKNLKRAEKAGVNVPKPYAFYRNILVMGFIGRDGVPAPLLREATPRDPEDFYHRLLREVRLLYTGAGLVHGDLSEYNIMIWEEKPVIFDISQAVLLDHPLSDQLLRRDIVNINAYFSELGVEVLDVEIIERWVRGGAEDLC
ncbi:serine protein kinase RIO [Candidatus Bathyarchaeota archaeon]|nr:serine protein kinase RIO [Candidatus Bathyarchaeota archaeon]